MVLRPLTLIGIIVSIVTGIALGVLTHVMTRDNLQADSTGTLSAALRQVSENYVEEISEEELLSHAIDGMMSRLDDHSDYLDSSAFTSLKENTEGHFGGIGIELGLQDGYFTVISPIDDTPAAQAGMQAGDRITQLNGEWVKGMLLTDLIDELRGQPGTTVSLGVERQDQNTPLTFDLTRADIEFASVRSRLLEPGFAYIRISAFQNRTGDDVYDALASLAEQTTTPLEGLVVDLRNNPGGTLQSSVEVADHFLDQGLIVYTEGRLKSSYAKYRATKGDLLAGAPIVVLINNGSASASEIVAGALQDHGRAQLMGTTSYGKGSVQSVLPLDDDQALKITTAYYFTPNGRSIHKTGIDPDIKFEGDDEHLFAEAVALLKARDKSGLRASL
jgi:carboxyl-terminal processing protease